MGRIWMGYGAHTGMMGRIEDKWRARGPTENKEQECLHGDPKVVEGWKNWARELEEIDRSLDLHRPLASSTSGIRTNK
jgi:hypothetical protein